jgi:glycosyltransferase involved in cell wall biosynthesis
MSTSTKPTGDAGEWEAAHLAAGELALAGELAASRGLYEQLRDQLSSPEQRALLENDLGSLAALEGDLEGAAQFFEAALAVDRQCAPALQNQEFLARLMQERETGTGKRPVSPDGASRTKVAVASFLFNWPSTGGGIVHTVELAQFLAKAGFEVRHFYAEFPEWGLGRVESPLPIPSEALRFTPDEWEARSIQERFRQAVARFAPDYVILTDSWNFKPLLAQALQDYPYLLRFQALECLCPLNNIRLLPGPDGTVRQCGRHQLASPDECRQCLRERGQHSGGLHQAERALSGVEKPGYYERLVRVVRGAHAVLVVNPLMEAMLSPYSDRVHVVPSGMDAARFPWPDPGPPNAAREVRSILFAGLTGEFIKGFHVLDAACQELWRKRQDFELVVTADPPGHATPYTRYIGWQSQTELPARMREADICAVPAVAQEALGRTAVEAMAAGRPVVASRIGGLQFTVVDGATGLLCRPGDPVDLARKLEVLLDQPELRRRLGAAGRRRFEEHYTWDVLIEQHYRPLLSPVRS